MKDLFFLSLINISNPSKQKDRGAAATTALEIGSNNNTRTHNSGSVSPPTVNTPLGIRCSKDG